VKQVAADDGWPSVLQACKGDGSRRLLDEDSKGNLKEKRDMFVVFGGCM
jgi:hypothetical protein